MFRENGFCDHGAYTAGPNDTQDGDDDMHKYVRGGLAYLNRHARHLRVLQGPHQTLAPDPLERGYEKHYRGSAQGKLLSNSAHPKLLYRWRRTRL